jgi:hypothetical protein
VGVTTSGHRGSCGRDIGAAAKRLGKGITSKMAKDELGGGAVLLAFVVGAVAGAAVALLFAPATGEETRDFIGQRAREGREKVVDAARQFRSATEPEA